MKKTIPDTKAYREIISFFSGRKNGATLADAAAGTGLSLNQTRELVPLAADEYSARLEVSESGEILYSFPKGFISRYRGIIPFMKRFLDRALSAGAAALKFLFKVWIMVMLVGYFVLFIAIAVAGVFISISARGSNNKRRSSNGGGNIQFGLLNFILRFWFYSNMLEGRRAYSNLGGGRARKKPDSGQPLYRAVFSFVFGEDDPNSGRETEVKKAFISWARSRRGIVSLPELMTLTGESPETSERLMSGLCVEFGGSPEATDEGTIIYRFPDILMSGEKQAAAGKDTSLPPPLYRKPKVFSANPGKTNFFIGLVNGVNLVFGSYFFISALNAVNTGEASGIFAMVYYFLSEAGVNALSVIQNGLGIIPLLFSAFFWLIPLARNIALARENKSIRFHNFRSFGFGSILSRPESFSPGLLSPEGNCRPANPKEAKNSIIKEMGSYSMPDVSLDEKGGEVFAFPGLVRETSALLAARLASPSGEEPGKIIFDSGL